MGHRRILRLTEHTAPALALSRVCIYFHRSLCRHALECSGLASGASHRVVACAGGTLLAAALIGAAVLLSGQHKEGRSYPGVLALLADTAGHPKDIIIAQLTLVLSAVLQQ